MNLSFRKPIITRGGNRVRLYHIYQTEIHGAYETENDVWKIGRWEMSGYFYPLNAEGKQPITSFDLINEEDDNPVTKLAA